MEKEVNNAISILNSAFNLDIFPNHLKPKKGWAADVEVVPSRKFALDIYDSALADKHPLSYKDNPHYREDLKAFIENVRAYVNMSNPQRPRILINRSGEPWTRDPDYILMLLAHELGHYIAPTITKPLDQSFLTHVEPSLEVFEQSGYRIDRNRLRLRIQGGNQHITFESKRLLILGQLGKIYGNLFDELYADLYKINCLLHIAFRDGDLSLQEVKDTAIRMFARGQDDQSMYHFNLLRYADLVGIEDLLTFGAISNPDGFVNKGVAVLGFERQVQEIERLNYLKKLVAQLY